MKTLGITLIIIGVLSFLIKTIMIGIFVINGIIIFTGIFLIAISFKPKKTTFTTKSI